MKEEINDKFVILINTCDKFEDCWHPFFKLFSKYWPDYNGKIYLNTEYKNFAFPGLDIICTKVCLVNKIPKEKRATWSQCLKWALQQIDTDKLLYMQEDYFLCDYVRVGEINKFIDLMNENPEISCIQLTNGGIPAINISKFNFLFRSNPDYFSYASCQASLWDKEVLISLIRDHETAWNFEWWGSKRAKYLKYDFLVVDPESYSDKNQICPYLMTGIIGGKWYKPVIELFKKHQIEIDFTERGFYDEDLKPTIRKRIKTKLSIWKFKSILEILKMKYININK